MHRQVEIGLAFHILLTSTLEATDQLPWSKSLRIHRTGECVSSRAGLDTEAKGNFCGLAEN